MTPLHHTQSRQWRLLLPALHRRVDKPLRFASIQTLAMSTAQKVHLGIGLVGLACLIRPLFRFDFTHHFSQLHIGPASSPKNNPQWHHYH